MPRFIHRSLSPRLRGSGPSILRSLRNLLLAGPMLGIAIASAASLRIAEPQAEQTVHANSGNLTVRVALEDRAQLPAPLRIRILLDGEVVAEGADKQFHLENVHRGSHELQAQLVDPDGKVIERSEPVRFHVWQASRLNRPAAR